MSSNTISINPRKDFTLDLVFKEQDGSAYDLTGKFVRFQVRRNAKSTDVIDKVVTNHTNAAQGLSAVALTSADTNIDVRLWQILITLTDSQGRANQSNVGYLTVTNNSPTTGPVVFL